MKIVSSYSVTQMDGGNIVLYAYREVDGNGEFVSGNNSRSFLAVDGALNGHIDAAREIIVARMGADEILKGFAVVNVGGSDRISYFYTQIDPGTGAVVAKDSKKVFFVVDDTLQGHVDAILAYICESKLNADD